MSKAVFLFRPLSDQAVLSGGSWIEDGDVSLANVQNDRYWSIARSASPLAADAQIRVDMRRVVGVRGFALALPNVTTAAEVTVTAFADAGYTAPIFTTGPITGGESGERWKDDERAPIISAAFAQEVTARYWLVEIDDPLNKAGTVEVARLFLAEGISPSFNYGFGATLTFRNNTLSSSTLAGGNVYWRRVNPRQWQCSFNYLPDAEAFGTVYDFLRYVGFDREVFILPDPGDSDAAQARRFFATISQLDPLSQAVFGRSNFGFGVEERVVHAAVADDAIVVPTALFHFVAYAPEIIVPTVVNIPAAEFAFEAFAPEVLTGSVIDVPTATFELVAYPPMIGNPTEIDVPTVEFSFVAFAPDILTGSAIDVPGTDFIFTAYPPEPMRAFGPGFDAGFA